MRDGMKQSLARLAFAAIAALVVVGLLWLIGQFAGVPDWMLIGCPLATFVVAWLVASVSID